MIEKIREKAVKKTGMDWYQASLRRVSPYFTWFFLHINWSANQVTALSILPVVAGGLLFLFENPFYWLLAWPIMQLYCVLDCVDGEIARYTDSRSNFGAFLDAFLHPAANGIVLVFATLGLYLIYPSIYVIIFGISAIFFMLLNRLAKLSFKAERKPASNTNTRKIEIPLGGLIHAFVIPSALDVFFSNFRLLFLVLLGIATPILFMRNIVKAKKWR